jgi:4-hydroxy-3-methylbut-2-enyl diphosphate reductase IspH
LGFHGLPRDTIEDLTGQGIEVKDYKCPFIVTLDHTVDRVVAEGCDLLIVGKRQNHHSRYAQEVASRYQRRCIVIETLEDVETIPLETASSWALVGVVTANTRLWQAVVERVHQRGLAVHMLETICPGTNVRRAPWS